MRYRCPACRTRRTSFTGLLAHIRDKHHHTCNCGGYHYPHRPGSRCCEQNPMSDVWVAARYGATDDELLDIQAHCAWEKPGKLFKTWPEETQRSQCPRASAVPSYSSPPKQTLGAP